MQEHPIKIWLSKVSIEQKDFAVKLGVSEQTMSRYVRGEQNPPDTMKMKIQDLSKNKVKFMDMVNWKIEFDERG